jgi:hypothetical protein
MAAFGLLNGQTVPLYTLFTCLAETKSRRNQLPI